MSKTLDYFNNFYSNQLYVFKIWNDYYKGGGRQWNIKGQVTRSGKFMVDKVNFNQYDNYYINTFNNYTGDWTDWYYGDFSDYKCRTDVGSLQDITKKRMWEEENVLDFTVDQGSRAVEGHGDVEFNLNDNEVFTDLWTDYWNRSKGQFSIRKISDSVRIFGQQPVLINQDKFMLLNPYHVCFEGTEEYEETFKSFYKIKNNKEYVIAFFRSMGMDVSTNSERPSVEIISDYQTISYYIDSTLIETVEHGLGMNPIRRFFNEKGSQIERDIPMQDRLNITLTQMSEVFKYHLDPTMIINDESLKQKALEQQQKGSKLNIDKGNGAVWFISETGKAEYVQWDGLPNGILESIEGVHQYFSDKRGVDIGVKNKSIQISGKSMIISKQVLYEQANDIRTIIDRGLQEICNVWLAYNRREEAMLKVIWPPMVIVDEAERIDNEIKHYSVHGNDEIYLERTGFTMEDISRVNENNSINLET